MNDFWSVIISILISFVIGVFVMAWLMRGIVKPYLSARRSGVLLRVHTGDGMSARFFAAKIEPSGLLSYKDGKTKRVIVPAEGSIIRCARTYMADVILNQTAPFVWKKVIPVTEDVEVEEDGRKEVRKVTTMHLFQGYHDSATIAEALEWALMKPKRKLPGLGIDITTLLLILGGVALVIFFIMQQTGGGGSVI